MNQLIPNSKQVWVAHCEKHYVPLYFRPWWMDCVCGGAVNWDICLSLDSGGNVEGALLFHRSRYFGLPVIKMPPLTAYSGLWLQPPENIQRASSKMAFEKRVCEDLIQQLPPHVFFFQQWHPAITNWLPFFWKGFRQTTLYTYCLEQHENKAEIFLGMKSSGRAHVLHASQKVNVSSIENPEMLFRLHCQSLQRQNQKPGFDFDLLARLDEELQRKNARAILLAEDENGNPHAAIYLVWDERCTYFLLSGGDPAFRQSKAMYMLLWKALEWNPGNSQVFDFEGAMLESVEHFFRSFGGRLTPHFKIMKAKNKLLGAASLLLGKEYY